MSLPLNHTLPHQLWGNVSLQVRPYARVLWGRKRLVLAAAIGCPPPSRVLLGSREELEPRQ